MDKRDEMPPYQEASQAGPSSTGSLQQKYDELDSIFTSQLSHRSSATQEDDFGTMDSGIVSQFVLTIDHWCSRHEEEQRKKKELDEKKRSLQELHDKQQQMIVRAQMEVEQESSNFEAAMRNRETLQLKVKHACEVGHTMKTHCANVVVSMSQISSYKDDLSQESDELLKIVSKITEDENMMKQLEEIEKLQHELLEQSRAREIKEKEYHSRLKLQRTQHEKRMAKILKETSEAEAKLESQKLELDAAKHRREVIQKRILERSSKDDKELNELTNTVQGLEKKIQNSIETRLKPILEENIRLSAQFNELQEEISSVTGRQQALEEDKITTEKQLKVLSENLVEANSEESNLSDKLNEMHSKNLETECELESYRKKIENIESAGKREVSELERKLLDTKQMASNRSAILKEEIAATRKNCDVTSKRCDEKRNVLYEMTSQFESLQKTLELAQEQQRSLDSQLRITAEEKHLLSCISQELTSKITLEEKNRVHLEELLSETRQFNEEKENAVENKIKATEDEIRKIDERITAREANIALLQEQLEEVRRDSLKSTEQVNMEFNSVSDELRSKIAVLNDKSREATLKHQSRANELTQQIENYYQTLAEMENFLSDSIKASNTIAEETESVQNNQRKIQLEIEFQKTTVDELNEKCEVFERNFNLKMSNQAEMATCLQDEEETLKSKVNKMTELQQQVDKLEKNKAEASVQYSDELKEMMENILHTKQTCELLFSRTIQLNNEMNDLQIKCDADKNKSDSMYKSLAGATSEIEKYNRAITKVQGELDKVSKMTEKSEKKIRLANREKLSSDQIYDTLLKGIAAYKATKAKESSLAGTLGTSQKSPARDSNKTKESSLAGTLGTSKKSPARDSNKTKESSLAGTSGTSKKSPARDSNTKMEYNPNLTENTMQSTKKSVKNSTYSNTQENRKDKLSE